MLPKGVVTREKRITTKKLMRLLLGVVLAMLFVWLAFRHTDWEDLRAAIIDVNKAWICIGLISFFIGYACRIMRWKAMLRLSCPRLRWIDCAGPFLASFAANNVLPFRAGDLMRMVAFNRQLGTSVTTMLATMFVERLLDLLMVIVMLGGAVLLVNVQLSGFVDVGAGALLLIALAISGMLLFPYAVRPLVKLIVNFVGRVLPKVGHSLEGAVGKAFDTLESMSSGSTMAALVGYSLLAWIAEGGVFWAVAMSMPTVTEPASAWLALPIGTLATLIPSTPGYVGTFDFFTAKTLALAGNGVAASTAYALVVHVLLWLPPTLGGGIYLLVRSLRPKKVVEHE